MKPHKISTHSAYSDNCYFHFFCGLSDWVVTLWGFMKLFFKPILKVSAFYLEKQKSFIPKKNIFLAVVNIKTKKALFSWKVLGFIMEAKKINCFVRSFILNFLLPDKISKPFMHDEILFWHYKTEKEIPKYLAQGGYLERKNIHRVNQLSDLIKSYWDIFRFFVAFLEYINCFVYYR